MMILKFAGSVFSGNSRFFLRQNKYFSTQNPGRIQDFHGGGGASNIKIVREKCKMWVCGGEWATAFYAPGSTTNKCLFSTIVSRVLDGMKTLNQVIYREYLWNVNKIIFYYWCLHSYLQVIYLNAKYNIIKLLMEN